MPVKSLSASLTGALLALAWLAAAGPASAGSAVTTAPLNLREAPSTAARVIVTMPGGARVEISGCSANWCEVAWQGYRGYASETALASAGRGPAVIVIDPPYPYKAGHYRSTNVYYDLPPYSAVPPRFYPRRFILSPREHNRYRYRPHIFSGSTYNGGVK